MSIIQNFEQVYERSFEHSFKNILKAVTQNVIYQSQSTFIKGRHILYGIVIAYKVVDDAKIKGSHHV